LVILGGRPSEEIDLSYAQARRYVLKKRAGQMRVSTRQYAPWSEDTEDEGQPMTDEQIRIASERAAASLRRPRPQEPHGLQKRPPDDPEQSKAAARAPGRACWRG
jgi:hypothetical protein